jgi:hypothetical protein
MIASTTVLAGGSRLSHPDIGTMYDDVGDSTRLRP